MDHSPEQQPATPASDQPSETRAGLPKRLRKTGIAQDAHPGHASSRAHPDRQARALEHARACAEIAENNRGKDIALFDMSGATPLVDYFLIVSAGSRRLANAIASEMDAEMKRLGEQKLGMEGSEEGRWVLIDYGDFVVHIFSEDAREYYGLEDLWGDATRIKWGDSDQFETAATSKTPPESPAAPAEANDDEPSSN